MVIYAGAKQKQITGESSSDSKGLRWISGRVGGKVFHQPNLTLHLYQQLIEVNLE